MIPVPCTLLACDTPNVFTCDFCRRFDVMGRFLRLNLPTGRCKVSVTFLASSFFLGLCAGSWFSIQAGILIFPTMRTAASCGVSIPGLLSANLLPLLFSAFAVYISQIWLLVPIAFWKAFQFSYVGMGVMAAFGSAGWLIRLLMMFSDILMLGVLWWYWLRALSGRRGCALVVSLVPFSAAVLIASLDYSVISPFLADMITF